MKRLRSKILKYLGINVLISLIVLIVTSPYVPLIGSSGPDLPNLRLLVFLITLIIYWVVCFIPLTLIPDKHLFSNDSLASRYLLIPFFGYCFLYIMSDFHIFSNENSLLGIISFFLGQIISSFLVLRFIKENKPEQQQIN